MAKAAGALVYVDAVQFAPQSEVDVQALGCDFLLFSAYKFFGPHLGVLWGRESILAELYAFAVRCAPQDLPGRHEINAPQTELFAGLTAAVDYLAWLGGQCGGQGGRRALLAGAYAAATAYEMPLAQRLIDGLGAIPIKIKASPTPTACMSGCPRSRSRTPCSARPSLARALGDQGVNVWSGHNYALEVARHLELGQREGVLRIGLATLAAAGSTRPSSAR